MVVSANSLTFASSKEIKAQAGESFRKVLQII